jgi:hypothetical protein
MIGRDQSDTQLGEPFVKGRHYLQVVINEMHLHESRKWFIQYEPMAMVTTTYLYDQKMETSPFVVGPSMLKNKEASPKGTIFRNMPVTTMHPYQGGAVTLTVIFSSVKHENNAETLFKAVEGIGSVIDPILPAINFASYLRIADKLMDGVDALLGLHETEPLLGYQVTVNPDIKQTFEPHHLVLIDEDEAKVDRSKFWVKESRLHYGPSLEDAEPYCEHDFLLLQVAQGDKRSDERTLPFYPVWEKARALAMRAHNDHYWSEAKAHFNTLKRQLFESPDLTEPDCQAFLDQYLDQMKTHRKHAVAHEMMKPATGETELEGRMAKVADTLDALDEL